MLDVTEKFIEDSAKYIGQSDSKVGNKFVEGLQTFVPESRHYDVIWIQWVRILIRFSNYLTKHVNEITFLKVTF